MTELTTWEGRSKFSYEGSLTEGVTIYYGAGHKQRILAGQWANLLEAFSGQTVKVGTSRNQPPRGSLGEWLKSVVTKTAISSYVAPILVHQGVAERVADDTSLIHILPGYGLVPDLESLPADAWSSGREYSYVDGKVLAQLDRQGKVKWKLIRVGG